MPAPSVAERKHNARTKVVARRAADLVGQFDPSERAATSNPRPRHPRPATDNRESSRRHRHTRLVGRAPSCWGRPRLPRYRGPRWFGSNRSATGNRRTNLHPDRSPQRARCSRHHQACSIASGHLAASSPPRPFHQRCFVLPLPEPAPRHGGAQEANPLS